MGTEDGIKRSTNCKQEYRCQVKTAAHLQSQCLVTVDSSAKMGAVGINPSTEQGVQRMTPCPGQELCTKGSQGGKAPLVPAQAGLYMQSWFQPAQASPHFHPATPSHCWEVGRSRAQRESCASLPAVFLLAGTSPSSSLTSGSAAASGLQTAEAGWSHQG